MENNIIHHSTGTIIINGGNALPGCPESWEEARSIEKNFNDGIEKDDADYRDRPRWSFDCGFKLDFDGPLLNVSSRFYPPRTHQGPTWDGTVSLFFLGKEINTKEFDCPSIGELKKEVEEHLESIVEKIRSIFSIAEENSVK